VSEKSLEEKFEESFRDIYNECVRQYQGIVPFDIKKALFISYKFAQKTSNKNSIPIFNL
jgi:hypothetical protein